MPIDTFFWNNFSGGWSPNDDAIKGGGQNLLKMTNLELDRNGALSLQNGTTVKQSIGDSSAHTLYSRFLQGTRHDYTSLTSGKIFRDATQLTTSGSTSRTGFSTAFDDTLICSGTYRVKDSGTGIPAALGIMAPTAPLTLTQLAYFATQNWIATATDVNTLFGTAKTITATAGFDFLTQWETKQSVITVNGQPLHTFNFGTYDSANTTDTTVLTQDEFGSTTTVQDPNDVFNFSLFSIDGAGLPSSSGLALAYFYSLSIKVYLSRPTATTMTGGTVMTIPSDYFQYTLTAGVVQNGDDVRVISNNEIVLAIRRQQFQRIGNNSALDWNAVVGYEIVVNTTQPSGLAGCAIPLSFQGGRAGMISGTNEVQVQYAQMNVAETSSYTAKSILGPPVQLNGIVNAGFAVLAETPTDPQVTNIWIFRQDNGLDQWYRVLDIPLANVGTAQIDIFNDDDALRLDITVDLDLVSTASSGVTEDILEIIGPIEGRWYYFTKEFLYPSDIEDPDLTNVAEGIRTCGAQSEVFLWACKISEAQVLIGTSVDVYMFSGTFTTLPDGSIDVYYRPLGCKFPPIARSANVFSGVVYYLSMCGWTSVSSNGQNQILSSPGLDLLYQGETRYRYNGVVLPGNTPDSVLYPSTIQKAKLYCSITGTGRIEVYDFIRQYWRPCLYGFSSDCSGLVSTQDGQVLGYYGGDNKLRTLWDQSTKLIDGVENQDISILNVAQDGAVQYCRNRKDLSTFKSRVFTNGGQLSVAINTDQGIVGLGSFSSMTLNVEEFFDISQKLATCKWWQFELGGSFSDFLLQDCSVDADIRPQPLTFARGRNSNFQTGCQKRIRTWPFVIDTRGGIATITPIVDNVAQSPVQFSTPEKTTVLYQFLTDVFGIDYGYTVLYDGTTEFEFYGDMPPEIVQTLPIAKRFDQIGPQEFFRYGKVLKLSIRLLPNDRSGILNTVLQLPYTIYFNDQTVLSGMTIPVLNGVEGSYTIGVPKGTAGGIFRLELGPAQFDIHRFNIKVLVDESGQDTDGKWVSIG